MFENWQKLVSLLKKIVLFLSKSKLHQPMRFAKVRQNMKENSTSLSLEHEEQPRVSPGTPNIFKDTKSRKKVHYKQRQKCDIWTPMGCFCPDDT